ncbi:hypothetical protein PoB_003834300 [Plakobranchus ocellatus]|uniref:Uncharacterized protein n=1 Tax=Plakobranchus ocellatus TaxID=259542 RepID=A0AAV4AYB1_9GAST|nr:hypothetical protein PoB_003834300 [Plakobranchus ocellatus]
MPGLFYCCPPRQLIIHRQPSHLRERVSGLMLATSPRYLQRISVAAKRLYEAGEDSKRYSHRCDFQECKQQISRFLLAADLGGFSRTTPPVEDQGTSLALIRLFSTTWIMASLFSLIDIKRGEDTKGTRLIPHHDLGREDKLGSEF